MQTRRGLLGWLASWALLVLVLAATSHHVASQPAWNLDGIFYAAAARNTSSTSAQQLHATTYAEVRRIVPPKPRKALEYSSRYRKSLRRDPKAFVGQLPFYTTKPLYVWPVRVLYWLGWPALAAAHQVSVGAFFMLGLAIAAVVQRLTRSVVAAGIAGVVFAALPETRFVAALASPDMLCALFIFLGASLLPTRMLLANGLLCAAIATRPDAVFYVGALQLGWFLLAPTRARVLPTLLSGVAALGFALTLHALTEAYSWSMVMRQTFFGTTTNVDALRATFGYAEYVTALGKGLGGHMVLHKAGFVPYLVVAIVALVYWGLRRRGEDETSRESQAAVLLAAVWVGAGLHFLAFPLLADRLFAPAYVCTLPVALMVIVHVVGRVSRVRRRSVGES